MIQHRTYAYHEGDDIYEPHIAKLRKTTKFISYWNFISSKGK